MKPGWLGCLLLLVPALACADYPRRIVSLYPHATELVAVLDASRLVAVDGASNFPPQVRHLPRVSAYPEPSTEALLALRPDLVITWTSRQQARLAARLNRYGIKVLAIEPQTPAGVADEIRKLGKLLGVDEGAQALASGYEQRLAGLKQRYQFAERIRVFVEVSEKPLMTVSGRSFLGKMVEDCGGENIFASQPAAAPLVSLEAVLVHRPEIIVTTSGQASLAQWQRYRQLPAVQNGQLHLLGNDELMRPGPRLPEGMEMLCRLIDRARSAKMP
ncbi:iron complex transport system substrate-binding protein [Formivibrio citricus]|uniref:Iron complex transport system substrate-binding protein n=1 Tax=Formivibrio citricus TaxID=83765 RepID=A0A1I4ZGZ9_9NEIS|nr:cobalamin-binding protein [Formivibrio citricus]SFN49180.1 iron complex transport system substrate-binding protein [Formivibrio citricus]